MAHYNAKKELDIGIPMSPTGLARQATRKISGLGRTATLTRQATTSLSNAGGKRAQALEGLKQQVEDLKGKLQVSRLRERVLAAPQSSRFVDYGFAAMCLPLDSLPPTDADGHAQGSAVTTVSCHSSML